jgi:hypothetical protein
MFDCLQEGIIVFDEEISFINDLAHRLLMFTSGLENFANNL